MRIKELIAAIVSLATAACSAPDTSRLKVGILNLPLSLESWRIRDSVSILIGNQIHRGLIRMDPANGNFTGEAATGWEYVPNKPWILFRLDKNARFHDGSPFTCKAVKASFERLVKRGSETSVQFPDGTTFECKNEFEFLLKLPFIPAQMLDILASPPAAISKEDGIIGLGPYAYVSQSPHEIILKRVSGEGASSLVFVIAPYDHLIDSFKKRQIDDLLYLGLLTDVNVPCQRLQGLGPASTWLAFNARRWGFESRQNRLVVQQLFSAALHMGNIFNDELLIDSLVPFGVLGNRRPSGYAALEDVSRQFFRLVERHGKLTLSLRSAHAKDYAWGKLFSLVDPAGHLLNVEFLDNATFFERYYKHELEAFFAGTNVSRNDPFEVLNRFRSSDAVNPMGIKEPVIDRLSEKAARATSSEDVRRLAMEASNWIVSEGYALPLFSKRFRGCVQPYLTGYTISALGPLSVDYSKVRWR